MPKEYDVEEKPKAKHVVKATVEEHVFTEYGCPCGENWPKELGSKCPNCGSTVVSA